jgi:hypothetical protein
MRSRKTIAPLSLMLMLATAFGCTSPPSVVPLMSVVADVMESEARHVAEDGKQFATVLGRQRQALADAFDADLDGQATIDRDWLRDHVAVYVVAREALVRHELALARRVADRIENLTLARRAQLRAIGLIQRQDALLGQLPDLRRWMQPQHQEPTP